MLSGVISKSGVSLSYVYIFYIISRSIHALCMYNIVLVVLQRFKMVCVPTDLRLMISLYDMLLWIFFQSSYTAIA